MGLYLLDYGAGNVQSLANSLTYLGYQFEWISAPGDFAKATSIIFPGVGAFQTAVENLTSKGLLEPLREYILSGKPYFGICIGMQVLFQASEESRSSSGLGIISAPIFQLSDVDKSVPHIGWNSADLLASDTAPEYYYFVHSYCVNYNASSDPEVRKWAHTTTQYGQELFVSSVRRGNVFATQFHPEKSGEAGLALIASWLKQCRALICDPQITAPLRMPKPKDNLAKRIIACMDVRANDEGDLVVTKGDQYDVRDKTSSASRLEITSASSHAGIAISTSIKAAGAVRNLGKPVALAARYYMSGADELCLLNITSFRHSPLQDQPMLAVVRAAAACIFVPLTIGGGIKDSVDPDGTRRSALEVAGAYFRAGADKVSIGSEAVFAVERMRENGGRGDGSSAIEAIAHMYGRQAVVVSIDPRRTYVGPNYTGTHSDEVIRGIGDELGKAWWYQCTVSGGRESRDVGVVQLAKGVQALGAGEILLNSIDRDGTGRGFDTALVELVRSAVSIPVVASSGAGKVDHFVEVFEGTGVEAALAAGIFHRGEVDIQDVKKALRFAGINARV